MSSLPTFEGGRYRCERVIGAGGMGIVYEGIDEHLGRRVALKAILREASPDARRRFENEARAMGRVSHPHVVQVTDYVAGPPPILVMEFLDGETLARRARDRGPLSVEGALQVAVQVASALEAAHAVGVVHRDIKPSNIFVVRTSSVGSFVKVLDFGLALLDDQEGSLTRTNEVLGSVPYMAPERLQRAPVDGRADIFALGCVLFEMLSGELAFSGPTPEAIRASILRGAPLADVNGVPAGLMQEIRHATAADPRARHASASELRARLAALLEVSTREGAPREREYSGPPTATLTRAEVRSGGAPRWASWAPRAGLFVCLLAAAAWGVAVLRGGARGAGLLAASAPPATRGREPATPVAALEPLGESFRTPTGGTGQPPSGAPVKGVGVGEACVSTVACKGVGATCKQGVCTCPVASALCAGRCVRFDAEHCGACTTACAASEECVDRIDEFVCRACAPGKKACIPHQCVDLDVDSENCGQCGRRCRLGEFCREGECRPRAALGASCLGSATSCLAENATCQDGHCVCAVGYARCGSTCCRGRE